MYADDFDGEIEIDEVDRLVEFLSRRPAFDANNFVLTFEESGFPQLNILQKTILPLFIIWTSARISFRKAILRQVVRRSFTRISLAGK